MPGPRQFTLSIALGNGGVQSADDVATALIAVASDLEHASAGLIAPSGGTIRDANGAAVGRWQVI